MVNGGVGLHQRPIGFGFDEGWLMRAPFRLPSQASLARGTLASSAPLRHPRRPLQRPYRPASHTGGQSPCGQSQLQVLDLVAKGTAVA